MFALGFLAVFREGAETILFMSGSFRGLRPQNFLLNRTCHGRSHLHCVVMTKACQAIQPHRIFFILRAWLIYALATFKMLGVSIHALQLTQYPP